MMTAGTSSQSATVSPSARSGRALVIGALVALLLRDVDAVGRRAEAAQQRVDGERHHGEHGDLAQRVEAAEVDEDHVDDVGAAAFGVGALQEVLRDGVRERPRHHA